MTATLDEIEETSEAEARQGESEVKPASEGKPLSAGMEAAMGTCHKCGGSLCRGRKEFASLCGECGTRFHSIDCGDRLQRSGYQGMSEQCPKVRLSTCATVDGRIDATLAFFRAMLNTLSQGRERVIDPLTSRRGVRRYLEACAPRIRVPARRARPPRPSAEPLGVSPRRTTKNSPSARRDSRWLRNSPTHAPHHLPHLAVRRHVHVCRR